MGFFDEFTDTSGGAFVGKDDKAVLMEQGIAFPITALSVQDSPQYGERYVATVVIPAGVFDGEGDDEERDRLISFPKGTVESRDRMLDAMIGWLEDPSNEPPVVKLEKVGRSILVRKAE